ncbi:MAG: YbaN family protein [Pseudomonadales bacterium]|nr:YbaN family protein [Pseudomonadales bacterium]
MSNNFESDAMPFAAKAIALVVVAIFAIIGVIGLVLPIIPGIIFLGLAAWLLAKVSSRFAFFLDGQPLWQKLRRRWHSIQFLSIVQRAKLVALYTARGIVEGVENLIRAIRERIN